MDQVSRHTASSPSQQRTEFSTFTERFLRVEEHQVETQRIFSQILQTCVERNAERDRMLAEAMITVGKGFNALAHAIKRDLKEIKDISVKHVIMSTCIGNESANRTDAPGRARGGERGAGGGSAFQRGP
ncbi:hypothetical protein ACJJTC_000733 [Scirpophaga incertulas]